MIVIDDILDLKLCKTLIRKRYVYTHNNIKFEIDKYSEPVMNVVGIEGKKDEVDSTYNDIKELVNDYSINDYSIKE